MGIAVLGLGRMGQAVATRLLEKGYEVTVWNRTPGREGDLPGRGARVAGRVADAVEGSEVVMTLLTADEAVKQVCLGDDGAIAHLSMEAVLVDMSTVSPDTSRQLGEATPGDRFVDAPILGGPEGTVAGRARLLLGGKQAVVNGLDRLWGDLSSGYTYCGPNGSATTMKLLSNLNLIGGTVLLAEGVAAAQASGIGTEVIEQVFGSSPAVAPGVRARLDDIIEGSHQGWWTIKLAEKDLSLALQLAAKAGITLPIGNCLEGVLQKTDDLGHGEQDLGAVVEAIRRKTG